MIDRFQQDECEQQYSIIYKICNDVMSKRLLQIENGIDNKIESNQQNAFLVNKKVNLFYKVAKQLSENLKSTIKQLDALVSQTDQKQEEISA